MVVRQCSRSGSGGLVTFWTSWIRYYLYGSGSFLFLEGALLIELGLREKKFDNFFFKIFKLNRRFKHGGVIRPLKTYFPPRKIAQVLVEWISGHFQG
jgi:hypothetical protein